MVAQINACGMFKKQLKMAGVPEWLRQKDKEMIEIEEAYMELLVDKWIYYARVASTRSFFYQNFNDVLY